MDKSSILLIRNYSRKRTVYVEELMRIPVLKASEMSPDQLALVSAHRPPLTPAAMLRCLSLEFNEPVIQTDWSKYSDPVVVQQKSIIHQLIADTLQAWRKRADKCPQNWRDLAQFVRKFVRDEGKLLRQEMNTGDVSRWSGEEYLYGEWRDKLSKEQMAMTKPAFEELAGTPKIHPLIKREILGHICELISKV